MTADNYAKILWDFQKLDQPIEPCDVIVVPGSHDNIPAEYAAELFKKGFGKYLVVSGGVLQTDPVTRLKKDRTEAEVYREIALKAGVPEDKILLENKATNSGENLLFTFQLLKQKNIDPQTVLLVQKPYTERRMKALVEKQIPQKKFIIASKPMTFEEYMSRPTPKHYIIESMVGDLQRLKVYGENGFQVRVEIPEKVWNAYEKLVEMGYTRRMIK